MVRMFSGKVYAYQIFCGLDSGFQCANSTANGLRSDAERLKDPSTLTPRNEIPALESEEPCVNPCQGRNYKSQSAPR